MLIILAIGTIFSSSFFLFLTALYLFLVEYMCFSPSVVVVDQCSISNIMYTGDIEALFVLVHAVIDC